MAKAQSSIVVGSMVTVIKDDENSGKTGEVMEIVNDEYIVMFPYSSLTYIFTADELEALEDF